MLSGIPGSGTQDYGVPFSLTEEFAAVYRMHPLLPDEYRLKYAATGTVVRSACFAATGRAGEPDHFRRHTLPDLFYSFGTEYAGAIVLRNFPRALQNFVRPNDGKADGHRRRGHCPHAGGWGPAVQRVPPAAPAPTRSRSFGELTDDPPLAIELEELYGGDVERLDLMIGMFAEKRPNGFAFSDTAFRIFILMASRRLNSDRFYTRDYDRASTPRPVCEWIDDATMAKALLRHWPALSTALPVGATLSSRGRARSTNAVGGHRDARHLRPSPTGDPIFTPLAFPSGLTLKNRVLRSNISGPHRQLRRQRARWPG